MRLAKAGGIEIAAELKKLAKVLSLAANRTPRSLVRRINTVLVDIALRDAASLPDSLKKEHEPYPHFSGLCIVQRTLEAAIGTDLTRDLAQDNTLCEVILKGNIWGIDDAIKAARQGDPTRRGVNTKPRLHGSGSGTGDGAGFGHGDSEGAGRGDGTGGQITEPERERAFPIGDEPPTRDPVAVLGWRGIFEAIYAVKFLWYEEGWREGEKFKGTSLLTSPYGQRGRRDRRGHRPDVGGIAQAPFFSVFSNSAMGRGPGGGHPRNL